MKRYGILVASALTVTAGAALAAMGPNFGLPQNWSTTAARGYGSQTGVNGNGASAMCVECHSVNPSSLLLQVSDQGAATIDKANVDYRGSHYVMNAQAANFLANQSHSGGGFAGGWTTGGAQPREGGQYLRSQGWAATAWTSGGIAANSLSKFGWGANVTNYAYEGGGTATANTAEVICESCHNIIANALGADAAGTPDNDLLLGVYQDNVQDSICTGCHAGDESGAGRQTFHGNDNLAPFAGSAAPTRKRHHVMTGDSLTDANYLQGNNSIMWAPSASNRLDANWCPGAAPGPYGQLTPSINLDLVAGAPIAFRGACNVAGQGSRLSGAPIGLGDIAVQGGALINCSNCHRPHNAMSQAGAFILRFGLSSGPNYVGNSGPNAFNGVTAASAGVPGLTYGMRRQFDVDSSYALKVYQDYRPLCAGCHFGY